MLRRFVNGKQHRFSATALSSTQRSVASKGETCKEKAATKRDPKFKVLDSSDVTAIRSIVGDKGVVTDADTLPQFNADWFQHYHGESKLAVLPKTTEECAKVLKYCNDNMLAVVPQGGNTGFVGGSVPVFDEVIVSMKRMNEIYSVDEMSSTLKCGAGCVLEPLDIHLREKHHLMMPVDLGAKGSCFIGGNVATNAGGVRFMRYGTLRANTLGVKAALPNGEIMDLSSALKKDNTGYDMKQLFIGSEGTLGIITEIAMQLAPAPQAVNTMFLGLDSWEKVCETFLFARRQLGEILSAVEMIDGRAITLCCKVNKTQSPLGNDEHAYYLLLETNGSNMEHDRAKMDSFLDEAMEKGMVANGTVASDGKQAKHIWSMREACAVAPNDLGHVRWYDISQPASEMVDLVTSTRALLKQHNMNDRAELIAFGHLGDGNLHLNIVTMPHYDQAVFDLVDPHIYNYAKEHGFSVSAEHGIGIQKRSYLKYSKPQNAIDAMKVIKGHFDPNGIMNPYKMLSV